LEDSPAFALGNYQQAKKNTDVFAKLVSETQPGEKQNKKEEIVSDDPNTAFYSEESLVGYRWFDTKNVPVMYPFGYGLTYTTFEYTKLKTDQPKYKKNDVILVSFDLKNTGKMTADEVVQVYIHRINPKVEWPQKELKAFLRVPLDPGKNRTVKLEIPVENLRFWNKSIQNWDDDLCKIELLVGSSANDIKLKKEISLR